METGTEEALYDKIRLVRFFVTATDFRPGSEIIFLLDDLELFNRETRETRLLNAMDDAADWDTAEEVTVTPRNIPQGGALEVRIRISEESRWPGLNFEPPEQDWNRFDGLRVRFRPEAGLTRGAVRWEFYNRDNRKFQRTRSTE